MCETTVSPVPTQTSRVQEFVCNDDPQRKAILNYVFGITRTEASAYRGLCEQGETTAQELAESLDRHRSNVYDGLDGLYQIGLATRRNRVLNHGGHAYVFAPVSPQQAIQALRNEFGKWVIQMRDELDTLETNCNG